MFRNEELDLLVGDTPLLDYYRGKEPGCTLRTVGEVLHKDTYAISMTTGLSLKVNSCYLTSHIITGFPLKCLESFAGHYRTFLNIISRTFLSIISRTFYIKMQREFQISRLGISNFKEMEQKSSFQILITLSFLKFINFLMSHNRTILFFLDSFNHFLDLNNKFSTYSGCFKHNRIMLSDLGLIKD